ncbi:hypothetical protein Tco_1306837, partial [Tanacetum coccineum]
GDDKVVMEVLVRCWSDGDVVPTLVSVKWLPFTSRNSDQPQTRRLPGRTDNKIKNYSNSHLSKKKETMEKQTNHKKEDEEDVTDKLPEAIETCATKRRCGKGTGVEKSRTASTLSLKKKFKYKMTEVEVMQMHFMFVLKWLSL